MKKISEDLPVVSILVLTYNSSKFILETLESVKNQTYPYLCLIISDDCSTDKTIRICRDWLNDNRGRFVEVEIIESPRNTGISANLNRGERVCKTKWVKQVSGDDILLPTCIEDNIDYVKTHENVVFLFSRLEVFGSDVQRNQIFEQQFDYDYFLLSPKEQLERLIFKSNCIPGVTWFYDNDRYKNLNISNDERIPMLEDIPKWINSLKKGISFSFMDKVTVRYRIHNVSLSTSNLSSVWYFQSLRLFYYYYQRDEFVKRYGYDKTVELEMELWTNIYSNYYLYRNLFSSKVYFFLTHIIQKLLDSFGRK